LTGANQKEAASQRIFSGKAGLAYLLGVLMRVFLTGGAGYIGSVTTEFLIYKGHEVVVYDNLSEGNSAAVHPDAKFIEGDLADTALLNNTLADCKPEAIMHFAASALVGESMKNPAKYFQNNVANTVNLLDAGVRHGVKRLVFSSSCATYGIPERIPIDERTPQKPVNPYGASKLMCEQIIDWFVKIHGIIAVNLRYFNAAGATERCGESRKIETHLIPNVLQVAIGKKDHIQIFGVNHPTPDGTCIRDYIHVVDLANAHELALHAEQSASYNVGTGEGFSVKQVIEVARKVTGHPIPAVECDARPGDPPSLVASAKRLRTELGWEPQFPKLQQIIQSAWDWLLRHKNGYPKQRR
jgi:UDP-glucose 4-epimerase